MPVIQTIRLRLLPLVIVLGVCGCDLTELTDVFSTHLTAITISGDTLVAVGDTVRLRAAGSLDGLVGLLSYDPLRDARWSSSDRTIAVVQAAPPSPDDTLYSMIIVRGVRPGPVVIRAKARGRTGEHVVFVHRPLPPASIGASDGSSESGTIRVMQEPYTIAYLARTNRS